MEQTDKANIGRIVHFVLSDGQHRPAMVVRTWGPNGGPSSTVNLRVFLDGSNDAGTPDQEWQTSVPHSEEPRPRTWHWPERE